MVIGDCLQITLARPALITRYVKPPNKVWFWIQGKLFGSGWQNKPDIRIRIRYTDLIVTIENH